MKYKPLSGPGFSGKSPGVDDLDKRFSKPFYNNKFMLCMKAEYCPYLMDDKEKELYDQIVHDQEVRAIESSGKTLEKRLKCKTL